MACDVRHLAWLRFEIARHDQLYFVEAAPEITDFEYDMLYKELVELEKDCPAFLVVNSPTQRVGGEPSKP